MSRILAIAITITLAPAMAMAHAGHDGHSGFLAGLGHPVGGLDHVLAMVAVGLWAAVTGGRALWALPLAFVAGMLSGGLMGFAGLPLPGVEPMIMASIVILGVLAALAAQIPVALAAALCAVFGLFHGHAHGAEGPETGMVAYAAGFVISTAALHLAGITAGIGLMRAAGRLPARGLGAGAAAAGLALMLGK